MQPPSASTIPYGQALSSPLAQTLTDNNQDIAGGVYVENFTQTAEVHLSDPNLTPGEPQFGRPTPSVPEPSSLLLFSTPVSSLCGDITPHNIGPIPGPWPPPKPDLHCSGSQLRRFHEPIQSPPTPIYGRVPKWTKGTDCKSVIRRFESDLGL